MLKSQNMIVVIIVIANVGVRTLILHVGLYESDLVVVRKSRALCVLVLGVRFRDPNDSSNSDSFPNMPKTK